MSIKETLVAHVRELWASVALSREQMLQLLWSRPHSPYLRRHRAALIISRVQFISALFAVLTVAWIPLDCWAFPVDLCGSFAAVRVISGVVFLLLAWPWKAEKTTRLAVLMLAVMLANPPAFYLASLPLFDGLALEGLAAVAARLYSLLPFVVVAGLSIFPLTVAETIGFSVPIIAMTMIGAAWDPSFDLALYVGTVWLLLLIVGAAALSCTSQLHYMISLVRRASQDPLTGVFTRRSGGEIIDLQFELALRQSTPFALAYFDIDDFKSINDRYGHETGDRMLRTATQTLREHLRKSDTLVRWGGEEFLVVMSNTDCEGAVFVMKRVMDSWLGKRPEGGPLTASIGIAEREHDSAQDWARLVEIADRRMYEAKQRGKRRCIGCDDREFA